MRGLAALALLASSAAPADLFESYPLRVGARWVYACESRSGDRWHPDVARWRETVTVTEHIQTTEGLVIVRRQEIAGRANPAAGIAGNRFSYLWRGNCLYPLYPEMWDAARRRFTPQFPTMVAQVSPDVCLPLAPGAHWRADGDWPWRVDGRGPMKRGPQDIPKDAMRLVEEESGGPTYVWIEKGVGPVASWMWHNGTYTEFRMKLVGR